MADPNPEPETKKALSVESEPRLVKMRGLDTDELNGELVLSRLHPRHTIMLNSAGLALWRGLDAVDTRREAIEVVKEALPAMDPNEVESAVGKLLDDLMSGGFLTEAGPEPSVES